MTSQGSNQRPPNSKLKYVPPTRPTRRMLFMDAPLDFPFGKLCTSKKTWEIRRFMKSKNIENVHETFCIGFLINLTILCFRWITKKYLVTRYEFSLRKNLKYARRIIIIVILTFARYIVFNKRSPFYRKPGYKPDGINFVCIIIFIMQSALTSLSYGPNGLPDLF